MSSSRRVVVVTGAAAGVGRAVAREFAARGWGVGLLARGGEGADALEAAAKEVEAAGGAALVLPADVADPADVDRAADRAEERLGPIDVWVNNAMTTVFAPVADTEAEEFRRVTEVTYLGAVHGTLAALRRMRARNRGVIVQVGSALAYRSIPLQAAYCASKHALKGFTESLRTELLHERSGVKVTSVHLPGLNTPQFEWSRAKMPGKPRPVPPVYQPEVAARAVVWAAEHPRREHWVGGTTVLTILANRVISGVLDRYLALTGFKAQQRAERLGPDRRDNLFGPVSGDHGAHGPFDGEAKERSLQWWAATHKRSLAAGATALAAAAAILRRAR